MNIRNLLPTQFQSSVIIFTSVLTIGLATGFSFKATAGELDNESGVINEQAKRAKDLPATVVVRVENATGAAAVLETPDRLAADVTALSAHAADFKAVPKSGVKELDLGSSSSSWYCYHNPGYYYAPTYYYWGYTYSYTTYYTYTWSGYSYYWYSWY